MRISEEMAHRIVQLAKKHISPSVKVWLFGSRVDDQARGGDIDLMIEVDGLDNTLERKINFRLAFEDQWGEQKVDIILHDVSRPDQPIHEVARQTGIALN